MSPVPNVQLSVVRTAIKDLGFFVGNISKESHNLVIPVSTKKMLKALVQKGLVSISDKPREHYNNNNNINNINNQANNKDSNPQHQQQWYFVSDQPFRNTKHIPNKDIAVSKITMTYFTQKRKDLSQEIRKTFGVLFSHHEYLDGQDKKKMIYVLRLSAPQERQAAVEGAALMLTALTKELDPKTKTTDFQNDSQITLYYTLINKIVEPNSVKVVHLSTKKEKDKFTMITSFTGLKDHVDDVMAKVANVKGLSIKVTALELTNAALVPADIEREFNVQLSIVGDHIHCLGDATDVDNLVTFIESKMKRETGETINLSSGPLFFFKKQLERSIIASGVKVSSTTTYVRLTGDKAKVTEAKSTIEIFKSQLESTKITKVISENSYQTIGVFLKDYFKSDQVFHFYTKKRPDKKDSSTESESEEESSVETDGSDDDERAFIEKYIPVDIVLWVHKDSLNQALQKKIQNLVEMKPGRAIEIPVSHEELTSIKKKLSKDDNIAKNIMYFSGEKKIVVQGLWAHNVRQLELTVRATKEAAVSSKKIRIPDPSKFKYYASGERRQLIALQIKYDIEARYDKDSNTITLRGTTGKIQQAHSEVNDTIANLMTKKIDLPSTVSKDDVKEFCDKLEEDYPTITASPAYNSIFITAPKEAAWEEIVKKVDSLKPSEGVWPPLDQPVSTAFIPQDFKDTWDLLGFYRDKNTRRWMITAKSDQDVADAIKALTDIAVNKERVTKKLDITSKFMGLLITQIENNFFDGIAKQYSVTIGKKSQTYLISGQKQSVESAHKDATALVNSRSKSIGLVKHSLPSAIAIEVLKTTFYWDFFDKHKVFIEAGSLVGDSGAGASTLLFSKNLGSTKIEVAKGSILQEKTNVIVNAANADLQHVGGVAYVIARAAGSDFVQECSFYVQVNGQIPTGSAVLTGAGSLSQFGAVIHAVAPVFSQHSRANSITYMKSAITQCLSLTQTHGYKSISIPAIGTGIFGVPKDLAAECIIEAISAYVRANPNAFDLIRMVDIDDQVLGHLNASLSGTKAPTVVAAQLPILSRVQEPFKVQYQWSWRENNGTYIPFDPDQNYQVEIAHLQGLKITLVQGDLNMVKNNQQYEINFTNMTELNTHFRQNPRPILRQPMSNMPVISEARYTAAYQSYCNPPAIQYQAPAVQQVDDDSTVNHVKMVIQLSAKDLATAQQAIAILNQEIQDTLYETRCVNIPDSMYPAISAQCTSIAASYDCTLRLVSTGQYSLNGPKTSVSFAIEKLMQLIIEESQKQASSLNVVYPWGNNQQTNLEVVSLPANSPDYLEVQKAFHLTMPNTHIIKIERIQNKWLFEKYTIAVQLWSKKANLQKPVAGVHEMNLFHGTRALDPMKIINGENGFDMRFSNAGMWGKATYFAVNASYSHGYRSQSGGGSQMFYSRVLVGETIRVMPNDGSLTKPPTKNKLNQSGYIEDYDSVTGETGGSTVFMVYENNRAFPEFIITY
eukprot:gene10713-12462_t